MFRGWRLEVRGYEGTDATVNRELLTDVITLQ